LGGVAYSASKFAMAALGITVAQEVRELGIRITNIYPGEVDTPILDKRPVPVSAEHRAKILQPEDVGVVLVTIASLPPRANVSEIVIKPTIQAFS
jgi:NADP-dependent 3-hydroxy acid dehydrogenase YdfG